MAYAAITCLMRTIRQSMELTGYNFQPLYEKLESLRAILEKPWKATDDLETLTIVEAEIAELAYKTEDMVCSESTKNYLAKNKIRLRRDFWELRSSLKQEIRNIDSGMNKWMEIQTISKDPEEGHNSTHDKKKLYNDPENVMVGHENAFEMILRELVSREKKREVVSIIGMGGIGKTTLATKLYNDPFIMSHFDIRAKTTVSQEYCARNVLLGLLSSTSDESYDQLADRLQKHLKGKRYLVVIDDIWTTEAWDDIKLCFPDCNRGSRILMTTRNMEVAEYAGSGKLSYHMRLMNFDESWSLLYKKVFLNECFPPEFEQLGKQIALKCGGLPLTIVVIAGLLSKIGKTLDEWQSVAKNVSSVVSTDLEAQCMRVLALSYHHLPCHLKPCFLYFAIFKEDELISVDELAELWAGEGFLKVEEMENIEEVAEKCLKELKDRSLIFIHRLRFDGKVESYEMHDVTRELCLREAQNLNFVNILGGKSDQKRCVQSMQCSSKSRGRISIHNKKELVRCRNCEAHSITIMFAGSQSFMPGFPFKFVRVLDLASVSWPTFPRKILSLIHLRYLALCFYPRLEHNLRYKEEVPSSIIHIPPSISSLCYLQTFILKRPFSYGRQYPFMLPSEILTMPQLRHLRLDWNCLRYHAHTEKSLKLRIRGVKDDFRSRKDLYNFSYLDQLEELEFDLSNPCSANRPESITPSGFPLETPTAFSPHGYNLCCLHVFLPLLLLPPPDAFPQNLKNLTLRGEFFLPWEDLSIVGKLPKLESLKLSRNPCNGNEWEVTEEGFPHLKFLQLIYLNEIRYWRAGSDHFPCLERLHLKECLSLDSIPQDFADITTLKLIDISYCPKSVENSAMQIQQDMQDNYGRSIEVHIHDSFLIRGLFYIIRHWRAGSDHFPCLEQLFLQYCWNLDSIPQDFADITPLTLIDINKCPESVGNSAKQIQQDIQDNYGGSIDVHIRDTLVVTTGRQLAKSLELQSLNDLGFSKRYVRCLMVYCQGQCRTYLSGSQALQQQMIQQLLQDMNANTGGGGNASREGLAFGNNGSVATASHGPGSSVGPTPSRSNSLKSASNCEPSASAGNSGFSQKAPDLPPSMHVSDEMVPYMSHEFTENGFFSSDLENNMSYGWKA
ncbi:hypothetical protein RND71_037465 [Anisodus tanguticus]|uniref:Uncharacterized protein n=1 Tax=Anisodus tanguticus TaxID=243964 RepID=A0AAE1R3F4_9SOLA|nr:hypothetical protein RND71_037465 [Anisodus tanguticus]